MDKLKTAMMWQRFDLIRGKKKIKTIAEEIGVSVSTLSMAKSQGNFPKIETLYAIAQNLNTTMEYLLTGENTQNWDIPIYERISSSPDIMAICEALIQAENRGDKELMTMVKRVIGIQEKRDISSYGRMGS